MEGRSLTEPHRSADRTPAMAFAPGLAASEAALHDSAAALAGTADFGPPDYLDGLRLLLRSYDEEARLTQLGRFAARAQLVNDLAGRAISEAGWRSRPDHARVGIARPIFILGLPRTGTSALHQLLLRDPGAQGLEPWLAQAPLPRPPRAAWPDHPHYRRCDEALRAQYAAAPELRALHEMSADAADECWRLLHQSFASVTFECTARVPSYARWCAAADFRPAYARYRRNLQLIGLGDPARRWVLKDASHLFAPDALVEQFPDACLVQTHRDPARAIPSVCSLNAGFRRGLEEQPDDVALGREQLELWERGLGRTLAFRWRRPDLRWIDVHFAELAADPVGTARRVLGVCGLDPGDVAPLADWSRANPRGRHGGHRYAAERFGLDAAALRERFADYVGAFAIDPE
jgi:hypothetical protein